MSSALSWILQLSVRPGQLATAKALVDGFGAAYLGEMAGFSR